MEACRGHVVEAAACKTCRGSRTACRSPASARFLQQLLPDARGAPRAPWRHAVSDRPADAPGIEHDSLRPGARVGDFEIARILGHGGFGTVYLAHDRTLDREVAIKEYLPTQLAYRAEGLRVAV